MKVYICGAITGQVEESKKRFAEIERRLTSKGFEVTNPHNIPHKDVNDWDQCMKEDIPEMLKCELVFVLDRWWNSKGAIIEKNLAETVHIKVTREMDHEIYEERK